MKNKDIWKFSIENFPSNEKAWPCRISIPVYRGFNGTDFSVIRPDGSLVSAQSRPIVNYPDGSPRWIQMDFTGNGNGIYTIINKSVEEQENEHLNIKETHTGYTIESKRLKVGISKTKEFPVSFIQCGNETFTRNIQFFVKNSGRLFNFTTDTSSFNVESKGEKRFQMSWKGSLIDPQTQEKILDVKCRIEFLAGIEGFSLSFQIFHCLPEKPFFEINSISCQFCFPSCEKSLLCQQYYSNLGCKRIVDTQNDIEIFLDKNCFYPYVKDVSLRGDTFEYPVFLRKMNSIVGSTVCLKNKNSGVCVSMRDFVHHRPKKITLKKGKIVYDLWPEFAGILNLQQGSGYRVVFDFVFSDRDSEINSFLEESRKASVEPVYGWLEKESLIFAGKTFHQQFLFTEKDSKIFSYILSSATSRFHTVSEMFHYGDTCDDGYTQYYFGLNRYPEELKPAGILFNNVGGVYPIFGGLEPVWSNNEYDAIYCLALEAMRTKKYQVFKRLVSAARHQIETDFVHYSDSWQQHRSTPQHSYGHIRTMSSLPSHQWTQGLYHYYVITGDDDVPDVIKGICDFDMTYFEKIPHKFNNFFNREYGWAILALVYGFEATGFTSYIEKASRMIKELEKNIQSQEAKRVLGIGFYENTVLLGIMAYHQATGEKWVKDLFLKWTNSGLENFSDKRFGPRITELFLEPLTYAYYLTGNKKLLTKSFWHFELFFKGWNALDWFSGIGSLTTKKFARVYRGLVHFVSACKHAKLLSKLEKIATKN